MRKLNANDIIETPHTNMNAQNNLSILLLGYRSPNPTVDNVVNA